MAADIVMLLDQRGIEKPVHVVGHDIGGIVAFTLASRWPDRVASLCISECLIPGTTTFNDQREEHPNDYFHYTFHCIENLPEALVGGGRRFTSSTSSTSSATASEHSRPISSNDMRIRTLRRELSVVRSISTECSRKMPKTSSSG